MLDMLYGAKNEIIAGIVLGVLAWSYRKLMALMKMYKRKKQSDKTFSQMKIPPMSDNDFLKLCSSGNATKVEEAIMNGANINAKSIRGWTTLMRAAWNGHTEIAEILIKHGVNVNAKSNTGTTALSWATRYGHTETADLLRKYGAK